MIDVHAHFADEGYAFPEEWEKIKAAGVNTVFLAGDNLAHSAMHRDFCKEHAGAYFCAGVHPEYAANGFSARDGEALKALACDEKCVAVGEIGLDYHYPGCDREKQRELFIKQLYIAHELDLPVQIHSRDSAEDMLAILKEHRALLGRGFLLHCYSHGADMLPLFAQLGAYFSFGGVACFKNAKNVWESVKACPMDRIMTETDSPYLSPLRGEKNTPANIPLIARRIAELKDVPFEQAVTAFQENAERLFFRLQTN